MKGADKHLRRLRKLQAVKRVAGAVVYQGADDIKAEAEHSITTGSAAGQNGGKHQHIRSKPGEPPNNERGDLKNGLKAIQIGPVTAEFRSEAGHAAPLEFGTSKMAARPYVRPARDKMAPKIQQDFTDAMNKLVRSSG